MTDAYIIAIFLHREKAANARPGGADHDAIIADLAEEARCSVEHVRELVRATIMGAN